MQYARYLEDEDSELHMLDKYPNVKALFIRYNTLIQSSTLVECLFSFSGIIHSARRNKLSDKSFETLLLLKANAHFFNFLAKLRQSRLVWWDLKLWTESWQCYVQTWVLICFCYIHCTTLNSKGLIFYLYPYIKITCCSYIVQKLQGDKISRPIFNCNYLKKYFVFQILYENVSCILFHTAKVIEKSIWKSNLYFVIEIHLKSNWSNSDYECFNNDLHRVVTGQLCLTELINKKLHHYKEEVTENTSKLSKHFSWNSSIWK